MGWIAAIPILGVALLGWVSWLTLSAASVKGDNWLSFLGALFAYMTLGVAFQYGWMLRPGRLNATLTDRRIYGTTRSDDRWVKFSVPLGDIEHVTEKLFPPRVLLTVRGEQKPLELTAMSEIGSLYSLLAHISYLRYWLDKREAGENYTPFQDSDGLGVRSPLLRKGLSSQDEATEQFFNENSRQIAMGGSGLLDWSQSGARIDRQGVGPLLRGLTLVALFVVGSWIFASVRLGAMEQAYGSSDSCAIYGKMYDESIPEVLQTVLKDAQANPENFDQTLVSQLQAGQIVPRNPVTAGEPPARYFCTFMVVGQSLWPELVPTWISIRFANALGAKDQAN